MKNTFFTILLCLESVFSFAQTIEVPFTQEDKNNLKKIEEIDRRLIRLEIKVEEKAKSTDQRLGSIERTVSQGFESLQTLIYVLIGCIFTVFLGLVGFIVYDRVNATKPVKKENEAIREENKIILNRLAEIEKKLESRPG